MSLRRFPFVLLVLSAAASLSAGCESGTTELRLLALADGGAAKDGALETDAAVHGRDAGRGHDGDAFDSKCHEDQECELKGLHCEGSSGRCVQCTRDEHCMSNLCDPETHDCVICVRDSDCHASAPHCDADDRRCVQCTSQAQCPAGEVCVAEAHACAARCRSNADCAGSGRPHCAMSAGVCVACTSDAECVAPLPFCELRTGSCVECLMSTDCAVGICGREHQCGTGVCSSNSDCEPNEICLRGTCHG